MSSFANLIKKKLSGLNSFYMLRWYFLVSAGVFLLDRISKIVIASVMVPYQKVVLIPGVLNLSYIYNPGAAFGLLRGIDPDIRYLFFMIVSVVAVFFILYYLFTIPLIERVMLFALGLILGGALGNFLDRIIQGKVLDFIDFPFWPTFNVADSAIFIGVVILVFKFVFPGKVRQHTSQGKIDLGQTETD